MFKTILVPVNLEDTSLTARAMQVAVTEALENKADIHVLTVVPGFGMPLVASFFPPDAMQRAKKKVARELEDYLAETVPAPVSATPEVLEGHPADRIIEQARAIGADLIVMPPHDRPALQQALLGSCTAKVVTHAHCSVLVVRH